MVDGQVRECDFVGSYERKESGEKGRGVKERDTLGEGLL